jgi:hypothetical protein
LDRRNRPANKQLSQGGSEDLDKESSHSADFEKRRGRSKASGLKTCTLGLWLVIPWPTYKHQLVFVSVFANSLQPSTSSFAVQIHSASNSFTRFLHPSHPLTELPSRHSLSPQRHDFCSVAAQPNTATRRARQPSTPRSLLKPIHDGNRLAKSTVEETEDVKRYYDHRQGQD